MGGDLDRGCGRKGRIAGAVHAGFAGGAGRARGTAGMALALALAWTGTAAQAQEDVCFRIVNRSAATVNGLYIVPPGSRSWQRNILEGTLPPDARGNVRIQDKLPICVYDILATFDNGGRYEERGVDLCDLEGRELFLKE